MAYLKLGPKRSIDKASGRQQNRSRTASRSRWWLGWSARYAWVERARAYDQWEWEQTLKVRWDVIDKARQILVDVVSVVALDLVGIAQGLQECDAVRMRAIVELLDRAGVTAVKEIKTQAELAGPGGGPIPVRDDTPERPLNTAEQALEIARILAGCGALDQLVASGERPESDPE